MRKGRAGCQLLGGREGARPRSRFWKKHHRDINTGPGGDEEGGPRVGSNCVSSPPALTFPLLIYVLLSGLPTDRQRVLRHNTAPWLRAQALEPCSGFKSHFLHILAM